MTNQNGAVSEGHHRCLKGFMIALAWPTSLGILTFLQIFLHGMLFNQTDFRAIVLVNILLVVFVGFLLYRDVSLKNYPFSVINTIKKSPRQNRICFTILFVFQILTVIVAGLLVEFMMHTVVEFTFAISLPLVVILPFQMNAVSKEFRGQCTD